MELFEAISARHSMRSFTDEPVSRQVMERLVSAASLAPSAMNEQPWDFYVTTGETRRQLSEVMSQGTHHLEEYLEVLGHTATPEQLEWYSELGGAPVVVACTIPRTDDEFLLMNKYLSVGGAIENMLLAATDLGLGACAVTFSYWVRDEIEKLLEVPDGRIIVSMIAIGHPTDLPPVAPLHRMDTAVYLD
ncbi:MAG: nitroreductase family protein [Actinobacteria bacterium]|nr:nitroreductase family protein [Actinomycetota bacterium]MDP2234608.1 nitroreductase family protein [Actinomycetota bacterium]